MGRAIDPVVWERWRLRLSRFDGDGRTVAEWCRSEGVSQAAFYQWRRKFRQAAVIEKPTDSHGTSHGTSHGGSPAFVPVLTAPAVAGCVVLTFVNGVRVEIPAGESELATRLVLAAGTAAETVTGESS